MNKVNDELLDHEYDGIREYDNPLPPWWVNLFYITVVWALVYLVFYHVTETGDRSIDEYRKEYDPAWSKSKDPAFTPWLFADVGYKAPYHGTPEIPGSASSRPKKPAADEPVRADYKLLADGGTLAKGKEVYMANCVPCHGKLGEGGIGPNMTDAYWIHGNTDNDLMRTIVKGVPEKGMLSWKHLGEKNMLAVASYLRTLEGTNPPNAKAPQGQLVKK